MFVSLARVAYMYYEQELTQQQIASRLHISRIKVSRLLKRARDTGVVSVKIEFHGFFPDLEEALVARFPASSFVVTEAVDSSAEAVLASLSSTAAEYLSDAIRPGETVAVGWGRTLMRAAKAMSGEGSRTTFVPLIGGRADVGLDVHANSVADLMATGMGGRSVAIFSPALAESSAERNRLLDSPAVNGPLAMAASASTCVFSVGSLQAADAAIGTVDYYSDHERELLAAAEAVCDVVSIAYFNAAGDQVAREISGRTVSVTFDQFLAIPRRVCVAGGESKWEAIRVCLRRGVPSVLITDEATARYLLAN
jgi:DNA-binding transcriptional regulator LsrR (DeoR family)